MVCTMATMATMAKEAIKCKSSKLYLTVIFITYHVTSGYVAIYGNGNVVGYSSFLIISYSYYCKNSIAVSSSSPITIIVRTA